MIPAAPLPRRAVLGAYVDAYAAVVILREVGPQLEAYAAALAVSPAEANRQMAREVQVALSRMREVARQLGERRREVAASATASVRGSAEAVGGGSSEESGLVGNWLSSGEVASRLRVSTRRVRQLCTAGVLEAARSGGVWQVAQQSVDDYLDRMEATG